MSGHAYGFYSVATDNVGNVQPTLSASQSHTTVGNPLSVVSITSVAPNPRNTPVSTVDVAFSGPVDANIFILADLTLADNGGPNLITNAVTITGSGSSYEIGGLAGLTTANGNYVLTVDAPGILGINSLSTSWLMDSLPPSSSAKVAAHASETSLTFAVSVAGSDGGSPASGISSFDLYSSTNGGPWTLWTTVPANKPNSNFTGQSNTTYAFYSIAHDLAGNTEVKRPVIEASTYVPNLTPPVTVVNSTTAAANPSSVSAGTGTFTLNLTGSDPGGGVVTYFEVFASIDSGSYTLIGAPIPAGPADSSGHSHATVIYQGLTDGAPHTTAFFSIGIDSAGNVQSAPANPNLKLTESFAQPASLQVTGLEVENGAVERSFIRDLAVEFNESDSQSGGGLTQLAATINSSSPHVLLYKYDLNGTPSSRVAVSLAGTTVSVIDHAIELDFGASGLGGSPNSTSADGYYELDVQLPNGTTAVHHFDRLLGDITGDGLVDNNDLNAIAAEINLSGPAGMTPLNADVTGDGTVSAIDLTLATRAKGRKLGTGLTLG